MRIVRIKPTAEWIPEVTSEDGRCGHFDVRPYLELEAFTPLKDHAEFCKAHNGGYFLEWSCSADLSADTIEAHWKNVKEAA